MKISTVKCKVRFIRLNYVAQNLLLLINQQCYKSIIYIIQSVKEELISTSFKQYDITMQDPITSMKVDTCFANSLVGAKKGLRIHVALHLLQFVTMVAMIPIDILLFNHSDEEVLSFFITASCITFLNLFAKFSHLVCKLGDAAFCLQMATELNHVIDDQPESERIGQNQNPQDMRMIVSDRIYNIQSGMTNQQAQPLTRQSIQPSLANMIRTLAMSRDPLARCTISIGSGISFALFIYGIVILSTTPMKPAEIVVMSLFLVSEFLIQIQVFLCLIFVALLPLICLLFCVFVCCCRQGNKQAKLPQSKPATVQIIQNTEGSPCSICFQNILLNEQVIQLPCSNKHVFHSNCIQTWTAVKPTCPNCRHDLSE